MGHTPALRSIRVVRKLEELYFLVGVKCTFRLELLTHHISSGYGRWNLEFPQVVLASKYVALVGWKIVVDNDNWLGYKWNQDE